MNRTVNNEWDGSPLLFAAFGIYLQRMLAEMPSEEALEKKYVSTPRLDRLMQTVKEMCRD